MPVRCCFRSLPRARRRAARPKADDPTLVHGGARLRLALRAARRRERFGPRHRSAARRELDRIGERIAGLEASCRVARFPVPLAPPRRGESPAVNDRIRVLALSPIPEEGAGCRFRVAQFMPYLRSVGIDVTLRSLFDADFFHLVYKPGQYLRKASNFAALSIRHLGALRDAASFDAILIYREIFPIGPALVEWVLGRRERPPIVFDFDDAIFLPNVSDA